MTPTALPEPLSPPVNPHGIPCLPLTPVISKPTLTPLIYLAPLPFMPPHP